MYIGSSNNDYSYLSVADPTVTHPYAITGNASSIIANRVSYFYDFRGPSVAVDTACSSSLVAVHQGVKALRSGEADVVVAGVQPVRGRRHARAEASLGRAPRR
ncbi:Phthiocerol synthesis polyketide synthase type I PpsA [Mycobacteroides abscessus subsp. abscessus]|nr:Phthiocerol synthesis polyketide synthase type I PpsA [Mycobacteroides abscessus subsp. abscessus]